MARPKSSLYYGKASNGGGSQKAWFVKFGKNGKTQFEFSPRVTEKDVREILSIMYPERRVFRLRTAYRCS